MKIEHIGIATPRIERAAHFWCDALGLIALEPEEVAEQQVRVLMLPIGATQIE